MREDFEQSTSLRLNHHLLGFVGLAGHFELFLAGQEGSNAARSSSTLKRLGGADAVCLGHATFDRQIGLRSNVALVCFTTAVLDSDFR